MRMVQAYGCGGLFQSSAELELLIVGHQGARKDDRAGAALALDHHARARAHDVRWCFAENTPARLGDFRDVSVRIHFRKEHERRRIVRIDWNSMLRKQAGITGALARRGG